MSSPIPDALVSLDRMVKNTVLLKEMAEWMAARTADPDITDPSDRQQLRDFVERFQTNNPEWSKP